MLTFHAPKLNPTALCVPFRRVYAEQYVLVLLYPTAALPLVHPPVPLGS